MDEVQLEDRRTWPEKLKMFDGPPVKLLLRGYKLLNLDPDADCDAVFAAAGTQITLPDPQQVRSLGSLEEIKEMEKALDKQAEARNNAYSALQKKHVDIRDREHDGWADAQAVSAVLEVATYRWRRLENTARDALYARKVELGASTGYGKLVREVLRVPEPEREPSQLLEKE